MYNEKQGRFSKAFSTSATLCSILCQGDDCGRIHFVSCSGHGDYEEGELEQLLLDAERSPDLYVEHRVHDTVEFAHIDGKQIVPDCPCGHAERVATFIEDHAEGIAKYIGLLVESRNRERKRQSDQDAESLKSVDSLLGESS